MANKSEYPRQANQSHSTSKWRKGCGAEAGAESRSNLPPSEFTLCLFPYTLHALNNIQNNHPAEHQQQSFQRRHSGIDYSFEPVSLVHQTTENRDLDEPSTFMDNESRHTHYFLERAISGGLEEGHNA